MGFSGWRIEVMACCEDCGKEEEEEDFLCARALQIDWK